MRTFVGIVVPIATLVCAVVEIILITSLRERRNSVDAEPARNVSPTSTPVGASSMRLPLSLLVWNVFETTFLVIVSMFVVLTAWNWLADLGQLNVPMARVPATLRFWMAFMFVTAGWAVLLLVRQYRTRRWFNLVVAALCAVSCTLAPVALLARYGPIVF